MTKSSIYIVLFALIALVSCNDDYDAPYPVTDVAWYTSMPQETEYNLNEGQFMAFIDASQNALSHKWIIEAEGANFLKYGFQRTDSLPEWVDEEAGMETTDYDASVLFQKPGVHKVRLYNTFSEKVTFEGTRPLEAYEKDGVWVIDTAFVVDVYAKMKPAYKVYKVIEDDEGNVTDTVKVLEVLEDEIPDWDNASEWETVDVEVGGSLLFVDMTTTDRPTDRKWLINIGEDEQAESLDSAATILFPNLGYKASMLGNFTSERNPEKGSTVPVSKVSKIIPLKVNVIKTTKKLVYNSSNVNSDRTVSVKTSGLLNPLGDVASAFTVDYTNGNKSGTIEVVAAERDVVDNSVIILTLKDMIYFSDELEVNYDASKGIVNSQDYRELSSFTGEIVTLFENDLMVNNADFADFEGSQVGHHPSADVGNGIYYLPSNANYYWKRVDAHNGVEAISGVGFMKYESEVASSDSNPLWGMGVDDAGTILAGKYIVRHKLYIPSTCTLTTLRTDFASKDAGWNSSPEIFWDLSSLDKDTWVTVEKEIDLTIDIVKDDANRYSYYIRTADNPGVTGKQTFYLDKFELIQIEERP